MQIDSGISLASLGLSAEQQQAIEARLLLGGTTSCIESL